MNQVLDIMRKDDGNLNFEMTDIAPEALNEMLEVNCLSFRIPET